MRFYLLLLAVVVRVLPDHRATLAEAHAHRGEAVAHLRVVGELRRQRLVRGVGLGHHHQPGGVLVEPVHDARPLDAADAGQAGAAVGDQRIDQRAGFVAGGRMHDETFRFVDDDDVVVLVDDVERDVLRFRLGGNGGRHVDCDRIARGDMISGVANGPGADRNRTCEDQGFQSRPRQLRRSRRQHAVEPNRTFVARDRDIQPLTLIHRHVLFHQRAFAND